MSQTSSQLRLLIEAVERQLAHYYGFDLDVSAIDYLIDHEEATKLDLLSGQDHVQGQTWLIPTLNSDQEGFLGLYFAPEVISVIERLSPLLRVNSINRNALCVVVEEVSHFHLLMRRLSQDQELTLLELEWQAEMDKLLVMALFTFEQQQSIYLVELIDTLYMKVGIFAENFDLYWDATKLAENFWRSYQYSRSQPAKLLWSEELRPLLRRSYDLSLQQKLHHLQVAA